MAEVFKIEEERLSIDFFGEVVDCRAPTSAEEEQVQESFKSYDPEAGSSAARIYKDFFIKLGLPEDKLAKCSSNQLLKLFSFVVAPKKN